MNANQVTALFLDLGGVLLTNGWDRSMRKRAAETFHLEFEEMDERHHLTFDTYESGKLNLDEYLRRVIFYRDRAFTPEDFKSYMFSQSRPFPEMIDLIQKVKDRYHLKIATVSNEGRELTEYRIRTFQLGRFIDFFISSCFVHFRKPDEDIYRIALDLAQAKPEQVIYIEDRLLFVEEAREMGLYAIQHTGYDATRAALATCGFPVEG